MRADRPPVRHALAELPYGCDELKAPIDLDSDTCLRAHLDGLPDPYLDRANFLSNVAIQPTPSVPDDDPTKSEELVLRLDDLLRTNLQGYHALHPRVQQAVSLGAFDPLLKTIGTRLDKLSILRDLRADEILTTSCGLDDKPPSQDTIRATCDSLQQRGENHIISFRLLLEDHSSFQPPKLAFHDDVVPDACPDLAQLFDLVSYRSDQCRADLRLSIVSYLSSVLSDD